MLSSNLIKGNMSLILLSSLIDGDKYGYEITKEILKLTNNEIQLKEGSLYPALHKLEKLGMVESYWQQQELGKPGRKYYKITPDGLKYVKEERKNWSSLIEIMRRVIYGQE